MKDVRIGFFEEPKKEDTMDKIMKELDRLDLMFEEMIKKAVLFKKNKGETK